MPPSPKIINPSKTATTTPSTAATTTTTNGSTGSGHSMAGQSDKVFNKIAIITSFSYVSSLLTIYMLINDEVPQPYMDEIFHVQQVQSYCVHNFTHWNPKITTPPGLYLTTWALFKPMSELIAFGEDDPTRKCPVQMVRFINLLFAFANVYLMYSITISNYRSPSRIIKVRALFSSVSLSAFPPLFFFNFLYYTDAGSLFLILTMYLAHINGHVHLAAVFGFLSLFYRQTNIVWVCFLATHSALKMIFQSNLRDFRSKKKLKLLTSSISTLPRVLFNLIGYVVVGILFCVFIFYNKGIVLGDKSAHQATFHAAQLVYFSYFMSFFAAPWILESSNLQSFAVFCYKRSLNIILTLIALGLLLMHQKSPHPYLLADNRHYTFYIWRRLFGNTSSIIRYALLPMCCLTLWSLINLGKNTFFQCLFIIFTTISIVPQALIEFRYFIPAFVVWRLTININSSFSLALEFALNIFVNIVTIYIFLYHPYKWTNSRELQRFMW
ncbi:alpha-1,2-glucosyltransferase Alg10 [Brevipalpus obovatus]|uniref:alpha-1,2-glucosyltransferase Alg10 n=1 Tax=Brevipalpus obovatus TaxID=246614 RepID=UPI003D9F99B0